MKVDKSIVFKFFKKKIFDTELQRISNWEIVGDAVLDGNHLKFSVLAETNIFERPITFPFALHFDFELFSNGMFVICNSYEMKIGGTDIVYDGGGFPVFEELNEIKQYLVNYTI